MNKTATEWTDYAMRQCSTCQEWSRDPHPHGFGFCASRFVGGKDKHESHTCDWWWPIQPEPPLGTGK